MSAPERFRTGEDLEGAVSDLLDRLKEILFQLRR